MNVNRFRQGLDALTFWRLKNLPPVSKEIAEKRRDACLKCPLNWPEDRFEPAGRFEEIARRGFIRGVERRHNVSMKLEGQENLKICAACGCNLALKVWTPNEVIWKDEQPDYWNELDEQCWIRKEKT